MDKQHIVSTKKKNNNPKFEKYFGKGFVCDSELMVEHFISLAEAVRSAVCCWEPDTTLTFVNRNYKDLFKSKKDILGTKWISVFSPEEQKTIKEQHKKLLKKPDIFIHEQVTKDAQGQKKYIEWTDYPIVNNNGKIVRFLSIGRDVTDIKSSQQKLADVQNRNTQLIESMHDGLVMQDENGIITYANESFLRIGQCKTEDVLGKSIFELYCVDPAIVNILIEQFRKQGRLNKKFKTIALERPVFSTHVQVSTIPITVSDNVFRGSFAIFSDVSDQKKYEERLKKINKYLLNLGPDPLKNIQCLTRLLGEIMGATCALYNHLEKDTLISFGQWQVPDDYAPEDKAKGHICFDVIKNRNEQPYIVRNLPETTYYVTDPNVEKYDLKTYVGQAVKCENSFVGSLCVVFQEDFAPLKDDLKIMGIIAAAIGTEEEKRRSQDHLEHKIKLQQAISHISSLFVGDFDLDEAIDSAIEKMGSLVGASRVFVFLRSHNGAMSNTHDWCALGIKKQSQKLQNIPTKKYKWWMKNLEKGDVIRITNLEEIKKDAPAEYELISRLDVMSLIALPIKTHDDVKGFIGFDHAHASREWSDEDLLLLRVVSEIFSSAIERHAAEKKIKSTLDKYRSAKREWEITVDSLPQIIFLLDENAQIVRVNKPIEEWNVNSLRDAYHKTIHQTLHSHCRKKQCELKMQLNMMWNSVKKDKNAEIIYTSDSLGKTICIKMYPHTKEKDDGYAAIVIAYDITEKVKANKKIFDMFKYLGVINRKISILLDVRKKSTRKDKKDAYAFIANSALQIADAQFTLLYQWDGKSYQFLDGAGILSKNDKKRLQSTDSRDYAFFKKITSTKKRIQAEKDERIFKKFIMDHKFQKTAHTMLAVPLVFNEDLHGILISGFAKDHDLSTQELEFYDLFALQSSLVLMGFDMSFEKIA